VALPLLAPVLVLLIASAVGALLVRALVQAVEDAREAQRRLRRLEDAMIPLRVESRRARASVERLRRQ
jgi:hypothetical protein